jgi:cephalosporin-C deacetylase-like acetyl esterase
MRSKSRSPMSLEAAMRMLAIITSLVLTGTTWAQEDLRVLSSERQPRKMLYSYLLKEAQKHFDARRKVVADLKTPAEIRKRQDYLKARFIDALGGFPVKTPLRARVVGTIRGDGFRVEKVIYESRPDHHVTANLYLPDSTVPVPGVLVPCGHSSNGKAADLYQRACILMAKNGLAALCYDPIGQGERIQLLKEGKPAVPGSTSEHTMVGVGALLAGTSTATYRIWDGIRSLDYLAGRPEIDPKRLGCTGNSGGGTLTAYLMALDDRIVAAAPSCYITSLERLFATIGPQDAEQNITGQVAFGMEHADYVTMRAPQATLMCVATRDFFDITGAWTTFREAKLLYGKLGHGERVSIFEYDDKHGFSKPRREAAMRWMRRWLLHKDDAPFEGDFPIFTDAELQCTRSGQVLDDFHGKSAFHLNAEMGRELAKKRTVWSKLERAEAVQVLRRRLHVQPAPKKVAVEELAAINRPGYQVRKLVYETEPGILVPALEFTPEKARQAPPIVYLHGRGMATETAPGGAIEKLVLAGRRVLALDLRGMGETAPAIPSNKRPDYFGVDWKEAFLGLHVDRPLLGQRVYDLMAVLQARGEKKVHVIAVELAGPVALHAAALDPRIHKLTLERSLGSWTSVVENPISHNQLANVVPGVLAAYDLPDLAALLAPMPLAIRDAVDGVQAFTTQDELNRTYAGCRATYERLGASKKLTLKGH